MDLQIDNRAVLEYLQAHSSNLNLPNPKSVSINKFQDGQSNPTYLLDYGTTKVVLRKAPPGTLLKGAHQVDRESQLMQAIKVANPSCPVPNIFAIEQNTNILGTKFFIMEYVEGNIYRDPSLLELRKEMRFAAYVGLATALASIHDTPLDTVLQLSNVKSAPTDSASYCRRQLSIWSRQYDGSSGDVKNLNEMRQLAQWLRANVPRHDKSNLDSSEDLCIVHGDFRMDNVIYGNDGTVKAILDWELSGVGDPIADLAYCCLGYYLPRVGALASFSLKGRHEHKYDSDDVNKLPEGIPSMEEFIEMYKARRTNKVNIPDIHSKEWIFFLSLSLYRIASICAGVYTRALQGNASNSNALAFRDVVKQLADEALALIRTTESAMPRDERQITGSINTPSKEAIPLLEKLRAFIDDYVIPRESKMSRSWAEQNHLWRKREHGMSYNKWIPSIAMEELRVEARKRGLWNLWLTKHTAQRLKIEHPDWPWDRILPHNVGLSHHDYAFIAMETGRTIHGAESVNCQAPDTGNMEILSLFGSRLQQKKFLLSLLDGVSKSCFGMTEPMTASSDPTGLQSKATKQYKHDTNSTTWVLNARKWWTTNACDPRCNVCIVIAVTADTIEPAHNRHSIFLVPFEDPGITVIRPLHVFGYDDAPSGHAEVSFKNIIVNSEMILGKIGQGFALAQSRLGPGRLHHCCRLIGHSERALLEVVRRGTTREAFGKCLLDLGGNGEKLALSRVALRQATLTALDAALELDNNETPIGTEAIPRLSRSAIRALAICKIACPRAAQECLDFAIQIHGGGGLSEDHPLASMWVAARTLRLVDGPDEVHLQSISKVERRQQLKQIGKTQKSHPAIGNSRL